MSSVAAIFGAISNFFGWLTGKSAQKNAPDVKLAAKSQAEVIEQGKDAKAIEQMDGDRIRKEIAE